MAWNWPEPNVRRSLLPLISLPLAVLACALLTGPDTTPAPTPGATGAPSAGLWQPAPGTTWQWQLSDLPVDTTPDAAVYDVDLFETDASLVVDLHAQGRR